MDIEDVEKLLNEIGSLKVNELKKVEDKCQKETNSQTNEENYNGDTTVFHKLNQEIKPEDDLVQVCGMKIYKTLPFAMFTI